MTVFSSIMHQPWHTMPQRISRSLQRSHSSTAPGSRRRHSEPSTSASASATPPSPPELLPSVSEAAESEPSLFLERQQQQRGSVGGGASLAHAVSAPPFPHAVRGADADGADDDDGLGPPPGSPPPFGPAGRQQQQRRRHELSSSYVGTTTRAAPARDDLPLRIQDSLFVNQLVQGWGSIAAAAGDGKRLFPARERRPRGGRGEEEEEVAAAAAVSSGSSPPPSAEPPSQLTNSPYALTPASLMAASIVPAHRPKDAEAVHSALLRAGLLDAATWRPRTDRVSAGFAKQVGAGAGRAGQRLGAMGFKALVKALFFWEQEAIRLDLLREEEEELREVWEGLVERRERGSRGSAGGVVVVVGGRPEGHGPGGDLEGFADLADPHGDEEDRLRRMITEVELRVKSVRMRRVLRPSERIVVGTGMEDALPMYQG